MVVSQLKDYYKLAIPINWDRSKNTASREFNAEVMIFLERASTDFSWRGKHCLDEYMRTNVSVVTGRNDVGLHTVVQPTPWKASLLPIGGKTRPRLAKHKNLRVKCN